MKNNTKSSITLPAAELKLVKELQRKLGAKSKVEVIRQGIIKLKEATERASLREAYTKASKMSLDSSKEELKNTDHLSGEGID